MSATVAAPDHDRTRTRRRSRGGHPLARFIVRRLAVTAVLLVGVTILTFLLANVIPGDPVLASLGDRGASDPRTVAAFREKYGLSDSLPVQYVNYMDRLVHGDLGQSIQSGRAVKDDLLEFVPATVELALLALFLAVIVGIPLGVLAAVRHNKATDQTLRVVSLFGVSMPSFWLALVAMNVFFLRLGWVPNGGRLDATMTPPSDITGLYTVDGLLTGDFATAADALHHLILPACVLAAPSIGLVLRFTRTAVLEVINDEYVRAARAKGMPERIVLVRHVLRAAFPSILTVLGLLSAYLMTGTVLIETIFGWPGIGRYIYQSASTLDLQAILGATLFVAVVFMLINLVVDILYGVVDPRARVQ